MTTMLEKVASRLAEELGEGERPDGLTRVEGVFDMREAARAALQAIREPDEAMMLAYYDLTDDSGDLTGGATAMSAFTAMIDAILAEPDRPT